MSFFLGLFTGAVIGVVLSALVSANEYYFNQIDELKEIKNETDNKDS